MEQENKDNVYAINEGAGEERSKKVDAESMESVPQNASTALGKFKDVDALYKAYGSLQAEFTRRSQRLKELERLTENLGIGERKNGSASMAEKLRKTSEHIKAEEKAFDGFVAELESATVKAKPSTIVKPDETQDSVQKGMTGQNVLPVTHTDTTKEDGEPSTGGTFVDESRVEAELSSEALYNRVRDDEGVRLKIIGEYLASITKGAVPLTKGGAGTLTAPIMKAKTLDEAGTMALAMFKRDGERA